MNLKPPTLTVLICAALQTLIVLHSFSGSPVSYSSNMGMLFRLINLAYFGGIAWFFFTLYTKQQKG